MNNSCGNFLTTCKLPFILDGSVEHLLTFSNWETVAEIITILSSRVFPHYISSPYSSTALAFTLNIPESDNGDNSSLT